jgi:hypothetical protein
LVEVLPVAALAVVRAVVFAGELFWALGAGCGSTYLGVMRAVRIGKTTANIPPTRTKYAPNPRDVCDASFPAKIKNTPCKNIDIPKLMIPLMGCILDSPNSILPSEYSHPNLPEPR